MAQDKSVLRVEEKRIGDAVYRVTQLGFGDARPLLWLGASVVLPTLKALGGVRLINERGQVVLDELLKSDLGIIGKGAEIFFERAKPDDFERVVELFTSRTLVSIDGGKRGAFVELASIAELHWPSRYSSFLAWLRWSVEVHFGPFSPAGSTAGASGSPESREP